jgi:molybdopterin converting factor small subunit
MAVVQEAFDIPADIMTKLLTGEYRRIGGVVRNAVGPHKGQIVKHLKPVDLKAAEQAQGVGAKIMQFAKNNKKGLLIGGAIAGATAVGGVIYYRVKTHEPAVITQTRVALRTYIAEIRKGKLELDTINTLMATLDELKQHKDYEKFKIELSTEDIDVLVGRIYDYTIRLAENNQVELTDQERSKTDNSILNLQNYLRTQKRIFQEAA